MTSFNISYPHTVGSQGSKSNAYWKPTIQRISSWGILQVIQNLSVIVTYYATTLGK
jgi:hypothetical protein